MIFLSLHVNFQCAASNLWLFFVCNLCDRLRPSTQQMPHLQFLQLEMNLWLVLGFLFFFFFLWFWYGFTMVCVFGFEFLAGFRSRYCRHWVCCGGSAGFVCLNTQDINWKRKDIFIEWRINQIKLHITFSLYTKSTLIMTKKKKQSHSQFQTHPFA